MEAAAPDYPPPHHVLRDLRLDVTHHADATSTVVVPVTPELGDETGAVRAGVLACCVDVVGGGLAATVAAPDWIATADLTLHVGRPVRARALAGRGRVLRAGRSTVVLEVVLAVADGGTAAGEEPVAVATMTFARLPRRDGNPEVVAPGTATGAVRWRPDEGASGFAAPIDEAVGLRVTDAASGTVELAVTDYVRNSLGAVQGGVLAILADAATRAGLAPVLGTPVATTDLHVRYVALGRVGPLHARPTVLDQTATAGAARIEIVDPGADDRLVALVRARGAPVR